MKLVIIAGGKGTRLGLTEVPKPMVEIDGKPLLQHHIELAKSCGIYDIIILTGHLSEIIEDYFKDGSEFDVSIDYVKENTPLGTAGSVKQLDLILDDDFLIFYGDVMIDIDINSFIKFHEDNEAVATLFLHPNNHPYDSDLVDIDEKSMISAFYSKPHAESACYRNLVNAGAYIFTADIFKHIPENMKLDFGRHIFPAMLKNNISLAGYVSPEYIKDLGTPERLEQVLNDYKKGKVAHKNKRYKQSAIFLDRDGVINHDNQNHIRKPEDLIFFDDSAKAVKNINGSDYLAVCITNQPGISKGFFSRGDLESIHKKMEWELGREGAFLDKIYYCPHHPDFGFEGEIPELKFKCNCRKPQPGMIEDAVNEFNIDLAESWLIGDRASDIQLGNNLEIKTILIKRENVVDFDLNKIKPLYVCDSLSEAVEFILTSEKESCNNDNN